MSKTQLSLGTITAPRGAGTLTGIRKVAEAARRNAPFIALGLIALLAIAWPLVAPYDPLDTHAGAPLEPPSGAHLFGTDQAGRDVFSRVLAGTRISFTIGVASVVLATLVGGLLGVIAAMGPRLLGEAIMRCLDVLLAFPGILLAIVIAAVLGGGLVSTGIVLGIILTPGMARFVRAVVLGELEEDYVRSARLLGTRNHRLVGYHIGINIAVPVAVVAAMAVASAILGEAGLSFIGLGVPTPAPSWGNIIADGGGLLYSGQWWISGFGGLAVFLTVLSLNTAANNLNRRLDAGVDRT